MGDWFFANFANFYLPDPGKVDVTRQNLKLSPEHKWFDAGERTRPNLELRLQHIYSGNHNLPDVDRAFFRRDLLVAAARHHCRLGQRLATVELPALHLHIALTTLVDRFAPDPYLGPHWLEIW